MQRAQVLSQLEDIYAKIAEATDQIEVVRIMEASSGVLRGLHAEIGGVERIGVVVEDLKNQMSTVDEIRDLVQEASPSQDAVEDSLVDEELEELFKQKQLEDDAREAEAVERRLDGIEGQVRTVSDKIQPRPPQRDPLEVNPTLDDVVKPLLFENDKAMTLTSLAENPASREDQNPSVNGISEEAA